MNKSRCFLSIKETAVDGTPPGTKNKKSWGDGKRKDKKRSACVVLLPRIITTQHQHNGARSDKETRVRVSTSTKEARLEKIGAV